jgi:hypothetical protein
VSSAAAGATAEDGEEEGAMSMARFATILAFFLASFRAAILINISSANTQELDISMVCQFVVCHL